jgi:hypothetical protein
MEELGEPVAINFWPIIKLFIIVAVCAGVVLI